MFRKGVLLLEEKNVDLQLLSKLYHDLGWVYIDIGKWEEAKKTFNKEYKIDMESGDPRAIIFSLIDIGSLHLFEEEVDSALICFQKALPYAKLSNDSTNLFNRLYNSLAVGYLEINDYEKALSEINKIANRNESDELVKSEILIFMEQLDSAQAIISKIIHSDDIYIRSTANEYLSEIFEQKDDYDEALAYYKQHFWIIDSIQSISSAEEIRIIDHKYNSEIATNKLEQKHKRMNLILVFSFTIVLIIVLYLLFYESNRRKFEKKIKENRIAHLINRIEATKEELIQLKQINKEKQNIYNKKSEEKERLLESLFEIEKTVFHKKRISQSLLKIKSGDKFGITAEEKNKLFTAIEESFQETIKQLKQQNPNISRDSIITYCLSTLRFNSKEIGLLLSFEESTIRHRLRGIKRLAEN